MADKFERFSEQARKIFSLAQEEAQLFNHNYIGTEHLLLGMVREGDGIAARVLANLGVTLPKVRSAVEFIVGRGDGLVVDDPGLTPRARKVIELAMDEARLLNNHYIGTEHLLLGLIREGDGIAAGVLESLGVSLLAARAKVLYVIDGQPLEWGEATVRSTQPHPAPLLPQIPLGMLGLAKDEIQRLHDVAMRLGRPMDDLARDAIRQVWLTERTDTEPSSTGEG
jgi:ATP-dependent Clp protease ATP-binding subunit ClpA